jgi:septum formation protein
LSRTLVLASRSPRRAELLAAAGIPFEVLAADIDESVRPAEDPAAYVERLAIEKARVVLALLIDKPEGLSPRGGLSPREGLSPQEGLSPPDVLVLGADTTVAIDGLILGKPADAQEATDMLRLLRGRGHDVFTGVALASATGVHSAVEHTRGWFASMTDEDIAWYVASGQPMDKAGAYGIQGLASRFVYRIEGSYTNVVGLPVALVSSILMTDQPLRLSPHSTRG